MPFKPNKTNPAVMTPDDELLAKLKEIETGLCNLGDEIDKDRAAFPAMVIEHGADSEEVLAAQRAIAGKRERHAALAAARTEMLRRIEQRDGEAKRAARKKQEEDFVHFFETEATAAIETVQADVDTLLGHAGQAFETLDQLAKLSPLSKPLAFHSVGPDGQNDGREGGELHLHNSAALRRALGQAITRQIIAAKLVEGTAGNGERNAPRAVKAAFESMWRVYQTYGNQAKA